MSGITAKNKKREERRPNRTKSARNNELISVAQNGYCLSIRHLSSEVQKRGINLYFQLIIS